MSARPKTNIRFNGREYVNVDEMPSDVRAASDRAVDELALLNSGGTTRGKTEREDHRQRNEFNNAGEMSVDDRHSYHEALFPPGIAVPASKPGATNGGKSSPIVGAVKKRLSQAAKVLRLKR